MKAKLNKLLLGSLLIVLIAANPLTTLAIDSTFIPVEGAEIEQDSNLDTIPDSRIVAESDSIPDSEVSDSGITQDSPTTNSLETTVLTVIDSPTENEFMGIVPASALLGSEVTVTSWSALKDTVEQADMNKLIHIDSALAGTLSATNTFTIAHNFNIIIDGGGATYTSAPSTNASHFTINNSGTGMITFQNILLDGGATSGGVVINNGKLFLQNVTLQSIKGNAISGSGTVTVSDSTFQNIVGKGITGYATMTDITVTNTLFNNVKNTLGDHGSAIYSEGNLTVKYSSFIDSAATTDNGYIMGAIVAFKGSNRVVNISNSYFKDNKAARFGGAVGLYQFVGTASIKNCYFEGNSVTGKTTASDGGAIGLFNGSQNATAILNIDNSTFYNNSAQDDGSAVFVESNNNTVTTTISNSTFYGNLASKYLAPVDSGGAVQLSLSTVAHFINNTFYGNIVDNATSANGKGAAVGQHIDSANAANKPTATFKNNLMIGNIGGSSSFLNVNIDNFTDLGGNIGFDNGTALPQNITSANILGVAPSLQSNNTLFGAVGKPGSGYTSNLLTLTILPNDGDTGLADQLVTSPVLTTDARGYTRSNELSDSGAVEISYVKFDANGGAWSDLPSLSYNGTVYYKDETASTGYFLVTAPGSNAAVLASSLLPINGMKIFEGWYDQEEGGNKVTGSVPSANQTLYAQWSDPIPNYTVLYNGNGADSGTTAPVDTLNPYSSSSTVTVLGAGALTKANYTFANWNTQADGNGTNYAPDATFNITADTTLYAQWILDATTDKNKPNDESNTAISKKSTLSVNSKATPLTGDTTSILLLSCAVLFSMIILLAIIWKRKKAHNTDDSLLD